jgi:hypothetical protein
VQWGQGYRSFAKNEDDLNRFAAEVIPCFADKDAEGTWV